MELRTLFIEDNEGLSNNLKKYFDGEVFSGNTLRTENTIKFEDGISLIEKFDFDLIVLDLYNDSGKVDESAGKKVLEVIQKMAFIPVIFYTGHAHKIQDLVSEVVGVVNKGEGFDNLKAEIQRIVDSKIALLKGLIYNHLKESLRQYFWEVVDAEKTTFKQQKSDTSLGYLLLRRFANSLTKEKIKKILRDDKIEMDKAHPMEFYIYPINSGEFEAGEILSKNGYQYILLTPSCDYILRSKKDKTYRDVGRVLLARIFPLSSFEEYLKHKEGSSKQTENNLSDIIRNRKPRFFFLPGTPFIENSVIDYQDKTMADYEELSHFKRIARLDNPFAQSMVTNFIRYYNRIGSPDIDADYVIKNLSLL
jgi:DNA-binding response OmpR family regulator